MNKHKKSLNRTITIGCIIFLVLLSVFMSVFNLLLHRNYVYKNYQTHITDILDFTNSQIDADDLKICIETKEESSKYKSTLLFMDTLMNHYDDIHYFYAILPLNTNDTENVMSVFSAERYQDRYIDTEGNLYLGWISDDEYDKKTVEKLFEIFNGDKIVFFEEKTEWGTDYTGAMPIKDSKGNSIAILAVDIEISSIHKSILNYALVNLGIIIGFGILSIGIFLLWSRKNITKPIKMLEESAIGFVDHSHKQRDVESLNFDAPEIKSDNEIKALSDAVVKMTEDIKEYVSDIITAEKEAKNMHELASKDALTGIRNKAAYNEDIALVKNSNVGIAIVDINYLKELNDTYGHDKGDLAIKAMADLVCKVFSRSPVYRIGGDEFAIILRGYDYAHYIELEKIFNNEIKRIQANNNLEPWEKMSAAIGAAFSDGQEEMDVIFKRADQNMYKRKKEMKDKNK